MASERAKAMAQERLAKNQAQAQDDFDRRLKKVEHKQDEILDLLQQLLDMNAPKADGKPAEPKADEKSAGKK